jgi:hypothetical protein
MLETFKTADLKMSAAMKVQSDPLPAAAAY